MDVNMKDEILRLRDIDETDADIQYQIALCYLSGEKGTADHKSAEIWLRRAAEQGHQQAIQLLEPLEEENSVPSGPITEDNVADFCLLAEKGDADIQYQLAEYFIDIAPAESARYLNLAVRQGDPRACLRLARLHLADPQLSTSQKLQEEVLQLLKNAADCGLTEAMYHLGDCYAIGLFGQESCRLAEGWFLRSAEQGDAEAKLQLAIRYGTGNGMPVSQGQALAWAKRAQDQGLDNALKLLREAIARSEQEAAAWQRQLEQEAEEDARRCQQERAEEERRYQQEQEENRNLKKRIPKILKNIWAKYMKLKETNIVLFGLITLMVVYYGVIPIISVPLAIGQTAVSTVQDFGESIMLESMDPFEFLDVSYSGAQPNASIELYNNTTSSLMDSFVYTATPSTGLSNGDKVVISVAYNKDSLNDAGYTLSSTETTIQVTDIPTYVEDVSEIDAACIQAMENQALDAIEAYLLNTTPKNICKNLFNEDITYTFSDSNYYVDSNDITLATTYFLSVKDSYRDNSIINYYTIVYQIPVEISQWGYVHNDYAYFAVTFSNIVNDADGVSSVNLAQENTIGVSTTLDVVESEVATAYKAQYVVSQISSTS